MLRDQRMATELCTYFIRLIFGLNISLCGDFREFGSFAVSVFQSYEKFFE